MLSVRRIEGGYLAEVRPPNGDTVWKTDVPLQLHALMAKLRQLNCHEVDIADALTEADPEWRFR